MCLSWIIHSVFLSLYCNSYAHSHHTLAIVSSWVTSESMWMSYKLSYLAFLRPPHAKNLNLIPIRSLMCIATPWNWSLHTTASLMKTESLLSHSLTTQPTKTSCSLCWALKPVFQPHEKRESFDPLLAAAVSAASDCPAAWTFSSLSRQIHFLDITHSPNESAETLNSGSSLWYFPGRVGNPGGKLHKVNLQTCELPLDKTFIPAVWSQFSQHWPHKSCFKPHPSSTRARTELLI